MSYDIWLEVDTGGPEPAPVGEPWNYTSNCAPMWCAAGADLAEFHGERAGDCLPILECGLVVLRADPGRFRAMDPRNKWGSYDTLLLALERLACQFRAHPLATVRVWR